MGRNDECRSDGGANATRADVLQGHLGGEADDGVALVVEAPSAGPPGHLGELAAGEELAPGIGELGELLQRHRSGRHVHARAPASRWRRRRPRRFSLEAGLDDLAERRHHAGVVHGEAATEAVDEVRVLEGAQVVVGEPDEPRVRRSSSISRRCSGVVKSSPSRRHWWTASSHAAREKMKTMTGRRSSRSRREQEFAATRRAKGRRRSARLGALPLGSGPKSTGRLHHVVDAARLVREALRRRAGRRSRRSV